jgi:hypothetical protein
MDFNMLTFTKQDSILIAVMLGIVLSVPLLVPAFYGSSTTQIAKTWDPAIRTPMVAIIEKDWENGKAFSEPQWRHYHAMRNR